MCEKSVLCWPVICGHYQSQKRKKNGYDYEVKRSVFFTVLEPAPNLIQNPILVPDPVPVFQMRKWPPKWPPNSRELVNIGPIS